MECPPCVTKLWTSRRDRQGMVGGRGRKTRSQYCRPGEPAIANHRTRHEVNHQVSRRRVAFDARNRVPEWPWPISTLARDRSAAAATVVFKDAATSTTCCCRNSRDEINEQEVLRQRTLEIVIWTLRFRRRLSLRVPGVSGKRRGLKTFSP